MFDECDCCERCGLRGLCIAVLWTFDVRIEHDSIILMDQMRCD